MDAIAFDPDPIKGGKFVIQAKRYTNVVDVSAVRDLCAVVRKKGRRVGFWSLRAITVQTPMSLQITSPLLC